LVKSLSSVIDYNGGTTPKPISLHNIKSYLAQRHSLSDASDVQTVIDAFQQAYPHSNVALPITTSPRFANSTFPFSNVRVSSGEEFKLFFCIFANFIKIFIVIVFIRVVSSSYHMLE
jgi:hypothetical protein